MDDRCFACGRKLGINPVRADTRDGQTVFVGRECAKLIDAAGDKGWQPPKGGPRLYLLAATPTSPQAPAPRTTEIGVVCIDGSVDYSIDPATLPCGTAIYINPVGQAAVVGEASEALRDAIAASLGDLYVCSRVWEAWQVGTMSQDDFSPAWENDDVIDNIKSAVLAALDQHQSPASPQPEAEAQPFTYEGSHTAADGTVTHVSGEVQKAVADLYQHSETGRTRIVMRDAISDCDAQWLHVGALILATPSAGASLPPQRQEAAQVEAVYAARIAAWLANLYSKPRDAPYWTNGRFAADCMDAANALIAVPTPQAVKVPLTADEVLTEWSRPCYEPDIHIAESFEAGVRFAERAHGIHSEGERSHD